MVSLIFTNGKRHFSQFKVGKKLRYKKDQNWTKSLIGYWVVENFKIDYLSILMQKLLIFRLFKIMSSINKLL